MHHLDLEGATRIAGVRPGRRTVGVEHPGFLPAVVELDVARVEVSRARIEPSRREGAGIRLRPALFWSGVGAAAVGAGIVAAAAVASDGAGVVCLTNDPERSACGGGSTFYRLGEEGSAVPRFAPGARSGGVPLAPLGYSISAAGAGLALGALFLGDAEDPPWLALALGLSLGALSFTLSLALDGGTP